MTVRTAALALAAVGAAALLAGAAAGQFQTGYTEQGGEQVYAHVCAGCHMPDGRGAIGAGAYPALANNIKLKSALYPALVVVRGQKGMPSFGDLTDAQVADVVTYVRTHFGNAYADPITPAQVRALRPKPVAGAAFSAG